MTFAITIVSYNKTIAQFWFFLLLCVTSIAGLSMGIYLCSVPLDNGVFLNLHQEL